MTLALARALASLAASCRLAARSIILGHCDDSTDCRFSLPLRRTLPHSSLTLDFIGGLFDMRRRRRLWSIIWSSRPI